MSVEGARLPAGGGLRVPAHRALAGIGLPLAGMGLLLGAWQLVSILQTDLPSPADTAAQLQALLARPFHDGGPNDKGIFLHIGASLGKVFGGFAIAAAAGIPLGFLIGASRPVSRAINPLVQLLRPVSPLAWFPIFLVLLADTGRAAVLTIGITALWPTVVNTAAGVAGVPQDHRDVARVFRFGRCKYLLRVLVPFAMPSVVTGLRLSMGIGWMVIVATEMLSASDGIGFFVWSEYNNNNLTAVVASILFIGVVGVVLDLGFERLGRRFDYSR